jgi:hypothetical protein
MTRPAKLFAATLATAAISGCGREGTPTGPSGPMSFLTGTWRGTVTIQVNPGDPNPPPPSSGDMTWTFEVVPQTNLQSLRATIRSTHPWLTMETTGSTALSPGNSPPTQISTHGEFNSPRGMPRDIRQRRDGGGNTNRGGLHRHGLSTSYVHRSGGADERVRGRPDDSGIGPPLRGGVPD